MHNPDDTLVKRQYSYAGEVMHEYHGFPGKYLGPCSNEYPNARGGIPRVDVCFFTLLNSRRYVMNVEDETTKVDDETYKKINNYRVNLEYIHKLPVISAITTPLPLEKCKTEYDVSLTLTLKPIIRSYPQIDACKRLKALMDKINSKDILTKVEAMDLIMIPKMFQTGHEQVLEKVCVLLSHLRIDDEDFRLELILEMRCVIHKYARTLKDIVRLEEVIGLQEAITAREYQDKLLIDQGYDQGYGQGYGAGNVEGKFMMALRIKEKYGIEEAAEMSGFSIEELEEEKLNK